MLSIFYGDMPEAIYNTAVYFKNTYDPEWLSSPWGKEVIQSIDKSKVLASRAIESPVLGVISPLELSGGVKTLLLVKNCPDQIFNASTCGDNCAATLLEIGKQQDVTINLRHMMDFGDGIFDIFILNTKQHAHDMKEVFEIAGQFV